MGERKIYQYIFADIVLRIDSSFPVKGLTYKRFLPFCDESAHPQITFVYHEIDSLLSGQTADFPYIKAAIKKFFKFPGCIISNPLFNHSTVQTELAESVKHMDSIFIDSNQSSISIFDFYSSQLKIFFNKDMSFIMRDSRMGPYSLAPFLVSFSSAMIHSSALIRGGKTAVFLSPDEGGKTTSINLSADGTILSDDQNIVREVDGDLLVYGTPWGNHTNNRMAPIGAFFILQKANQFALKPEKKNILLSYLWNEHLPYHFLLPKKFSTKHFDFLHKISQWVPVYRLEFPKNYIDWDAIDQAMI